MVSLFYLGVIAVMGYAMSLDLLRAKQLVLDLRESEEQASLAADAAGLGMWARDIAKGHACGPATSGEACSASCPASR